MYEKVERKNQTYGRTLDLADSHSARVHGLRRVRVAQGTHLDSDTITRLPDRLHKAHAVRRAAETLVQHLQIASIWRLAATAQRQRNLTFRGKFLLLVLIT